MNNKSDKMDRQGARTVADLELKFNMGKSFAEAVGISDPSRMTLEDAKKVITQLSKDLDSVTARVSTTENNVTKAEARLDLAVVTDKDGVVQSEITLKGDTLTIDTNNFKLGRDANGNDYAAFSGILQGSKIGNGSIQLDNNRIEFWTEGDNGEYFGQISTFKILHSILGVVDGIRIEGDHIFLEGNVNLGTTDTTDKVYVRGQEAQNFTGTFHMDGDNKKLTFKNGLLVAVE